MKNLVKLPNILILFFICQCQHQYQRPFKEPLTIIPPSLTDKSANCMQLQDSFYASLSKAGSHLLAADLDFLAKKGILNIEVSDPIGRTLWAMSFDQEKKIIRQTGKFNKILNKKLESNSEGDIFFDGHRMGIQWHELPCLMTGKIPEAWLNEQIKTTKNQSKYLIQLPKRNIVIDFKPILKNKTNNYSFCTEFYWSYWWQWQPNQVFFCQDQKYNTSVFAQDFALILNKIDVPVGIN